MDKEKEMLSDEKFVPTFRILQDFCQWIVYIAEILQNPQAAKKTAKGRVKKRKFFHASFAYEYNSSYSS